MRPVDAASLAVFRIHFGLMLLWTVYKHFHYRWIERDFVRPLVYFKFHGFGWIEPFSETGMHALFAVLGVFAFLVTIGFLYRLSIFAYGVGFTYVFLLDKSLYLNHYYLVCLLCFALTIVPANRIWSVDSLLRRRTGSTVPVWCLYFVRFHVALPYVFGGIAKLDPDWLRGRPMDMWLAGGTMRYLVGEIVADHRTALLFAWGGLLLDLLIVPALLWKRTRIPAFVIAIVFHSLNHSMFVIGVFPLMMIGATTIFFPPDWPRRLVPGLRLANGNDTSDAGSNPTSELSPGQRFGLLLVATYVLLHVLLPFRHWLIPGNPSWTEEAHFFSWRMMLRHKQAAVRFIATDRSDGRSGSVNLRKWLNPHQLNRMSSDPESIRQFAHFMRRQYAELGHDDVEIRAIALCSLNGRKPQLLVDPTVDLAREPAAWFHADWIEPLVEPWRDEPWDVPILEWEDHVDLSRVPRVE